VKKGSFSASVSALVYAHLVVEVKENKKGRK
jgi:hypothetical protein